MLATCTDYQLLKWKDIAQNPSVDDYRSITTLRQIVMDLYNKSIKDIINELSISVNDEINSRNEGINMDKKLEARIARLEKALRVKNEVRSPARVHADTVNNSLAKAESDISVLMDYINAVNGKGVFDYSDDVVDAIARAKNLVAQAEDILLDIYREL